MANNQNLKPFTGARDPRRHNGRPKGSKNLATIIRELENENFNWKLISPKQRIAVRSVGSPWRAIVLTAVSKALDGDIRAMEWLRKTGYENEPPISISIERREPLIVSEIKPRFGN